MRCRKSRYLTGVSARTKCDSSRRLLERTRCALPRRRPPTAHLEPLQGEAILYPPPNPVHLLSNFLQSWVHGVPGEASPHCSPETSLLRKTENSFAKSDGHFLASSHSSFNMVMTFFSLYSFSSLPFRCLSASLPTCLCCVLLLSAAPPLTVSQGPRAEFWVPSGAHSFPLGRSSHCCENHLRVTPSP